MKIVKVNSGLIECGFVEVYTKNNPPSGEIAIPLTPNFILFKTRSSSIDHMFLNGTLNENLISKIPQNEQNFLRALKQLESFSLDERGVVSLTKKESIIKAIDLFEECYDATLNKKTFLDLKRYQKKLQEPTFSKPVLGIEEQLKTTERENFVYNHDGLQNEIAAFQNLCEKLLDRNATFLTVRALYNIDREIIGQSRTNQNNKTGKKSSSMIERWIQDLPKEITQPKNPIKNKVELTKNECADFLKLILISEKDYAAMAEVTIGDPKIREAIVLHKINRTQQLKEELLEFSEFRNFILNDKTVVSEFKKDIAEYNKIFNDEQARFRVSESEIQNAHDALIKNCEEKNQAIIQKSERLATQSLVNVCNNTLKALERYIESREGQSSITQFSNLFRNKDLTASKIKIAQALKEKLQTLREEINSGKNQNTAEILWKNFAEIICENFKQNQKEENKENKTYLVTSSHLGKILVDAMDEVRAYEATYPELAPPSVKPLIIP